LVDGIITCFYKYSFDTYAFASFPMQPIGFALKDAVCNKSPFGKEGFRGIYNPTPALSQKFNKLVDANSFAHQANLSAFTDIKPRIQ